MGALEFFCEECPGAKHGSGSPRERFEVRLSEMNGTMYLEMSPVKAGGERYAVALSMTTAKEMRSGLEGMIFRCTPTP